MWISTIIINDAIISSMRAQQIKKRYLPEVVESIIKSIELELIEDETIVFLGQSLVNRGMSLSKWSEFKQTQADNTEVIQAMARVESILEHRIVTRALDNKINTTMAIFLLKNKYNWRDSKVIDNNITIRPILGGNSNTPVKPV